MIAIGDSVSTTSQAITFALAGGVFALVTLLVNNHNKRSTDKQIEATRKDIESTRLAEKREDRQNAIEKEARDYARQDALAERTERQQRAVERKLVDVESLGIVTHALVNSDKTAAMRNERDACAVTLALMREVISLKEQSGKLPTIESLSAIDSLRARIASLDVAIAQRLEAQAMAERETKRAMPPPAAPGAAMPPFVATIVPKPTD